MTVDHSFLETKAVSHLQHFPKTCGGGEAQSLAMSIKRFWIANSMTVRVNFYIYLYAQYLAQTRHLVSAQ